MVHNDSGFIGARASMATKKRFVISNMSAGPVNLGNPNEFTVKELAQMVQSTIFLP
jgi:hypothetical protein